ncbi:MAG TPA: hypothetical protein VFJ71_12070 [Candidatus Limnocylindrales bacterium]|nr:hypothetical protein [Candidatus Limnocylindrales bacterium]
MAIAPLLALVLASCDLMVAPPSVRPSRAVATPEATPGPTPTEVDEFETLPPDPSGGDLSLVGAAQGLADLGSYRITVATRGVVPSATPGGAVVMTSTLIQGDRPAARFVLTGADGLTGGRLEAIVIGDEAWLREGTGPWRKSAGGAADFDAAFTTMSPAELADDFDALAQALHRVGVERRNGIRADHHHADAADPAASEAGLSDGAIDLWTATGGGYLVALALDGTWIGDDGAPVRTVLRIDVSRVDDPSNTVAPPR